MEEVVIVAKLKIKEEFYAEVYKELIILHENTHKYDNGCLQYDLHQNIEDRYSFVFVETWSGMDMLKEHESKEHIKMFIKKIENQLKNLQINTFKKIKG